ncbi:MAG: hypothetical protein NTX86_01135 [Candidatus Dependentiae bacterium]|nr:hypothetical protein [Candidatus Dependentiae bacterium]
MQNRFTLVKTFKHVFQIIKVDYLNLLKIFMLLLPVIFIVDLLVGNLLMHIFSLSKTPLATLYLFKVLRPIAVFGLPAIIYINYYLHSHDNNQISFKALVPGWRQFIKSFVLLMVLCITMTIFVLKLEFFAYEPTIIRSYEFINLERVDYVFASTFFLIFFLFFLYLRVEFFMHIIFDKNASVIEAFKTSWKLTKGNLLKLFMGLVIIGIAVSIINKTWYIFASHVMPSHIWVGNVITGAMCVSFLMLFQTCVYRQLTTSHFAEIQ